MKISKSIVVLGVVVFVVAGVALFIKKLDFDKEQERIIKTANERAKKETERYMESYDREARVQEQLRKGREEQEKFEATIGK